MTCISLYIHVPFCRHRCGYCDFNTYADQEALIPGYSEAVCREIEALSSNCQSPLSIGTIYFGGGTPSLLSIEQLSNIFERVNQDFNVRSLPEVTLEANPGTISPEYLSQLHGLGVNRLSFGMQSANLAELKLLGRQHTFLDVVNAVEWARSAKFENLNLDLIYGLPDQGLKDWHRSLEAALSLQPEHLSLYALTIEEGTRLHRMIHSGIHTEPIQDIVADMYETASERLDAAGYVQYEISNWARRDRIGQLYSCEHNLQYWRYLPYLGIGAGSHGFVDHTRTVNISSPRDYVNKLIKEPRQQTEPFPHTPATEQIIPLDLDTEMGETMMVGFRLIEEGVSEARFQDMYGVGLIERYGETIKKLISLDLLEWEMKQGETLRLTKRGRLLGNVVFREFI